MIRAPVAHRCTRGKMYALHSETPNKCVMEATMPFLSELAGLAHLESQSDYRVKDAHQGRSRAEAQIAVPIAKVGHALWVPGPGRHLFRWQNNSLLGENDEDRELLTECGPLRENGAPCCLIARRHVAQQRDFAQA